MKEKMNVRDQSDAITSGAFMANLKNSTMLKYMVSVSENATYPEFIIEICRRIEIEKTSNLEANKNSVKTSFSRENAG